MAEFPGSIPSFTDLNGATSLAANNHAARHNKVHDELAAVAARVGATGSTDPDSHTKQIADLQADVSDAQGDIDALPTVGEMNAAISAAVDAAVAATKSALHPVNSLYFSVNSADPATYLGFGTWVAFGEGRTIVGVDLGQTEFDTVEETGGSKTHSHGLSAGAAQIGSDLGQANTIAFRSSQNGSLTGTTYSVLGSQDAVAASRSHNTALTGTTDSGSNLSPYITVYMWKRTA